jgi:cyclophilin family peptidyl-prolyl cis-trans isomerase
VKDNSSLNKSNYNAGYAVFGKVTKGMDIADRISLVKTTAHGHMRDVPAEPIIIESVTINDPAAPPKN